jgi:integrase
MTVASECLEKWKAEGSSPRTLKKKSWLLEFAVRDFGGRPIAEIRPAELLESLRKVESRGRYETALRIRSVVGEVLRYAVATGRAERDITVDLRKALVTPRVKHHAAVTEPSQIGALLRAIDGFDGHCSTCAALRMAPLVFVRPGELRLAEWSEIDFKSKIWRIPGKRMKMGLDHIVPLSKQAIAILTDLKAITGSSRLIFPSTRSWQRPISENTLNAALRRLGYSKNEMTTHGFRSMASTRLNESGKFSADAIERQLAHQERSEVRRAYNAAQYLPERTEMMQEWANYLDEFRMLSPPKKA